MFPAFKEWQVVVEALGAGEQTLILRKGGIAEDQGGFRPKAGRFWLFPTHFHAQRAQTKPAAFARAPAPAASGGEIVLRFFAETVHHAFLTDGESIRRLDPFHLWTEAIIRERYEWSKPPGVHVLLVRVHRLGTPLSFPLTSAMRGRRSWIDPAHDPAARPSQPVLTDAAFATRWEELRAIL
jgi:hypothetical protein